MPTRSLLNRWGWQVDELCCFCGLRDTQFHRVWECSSQQSFREDLFGAGLVEKACLAGDQHLGYSRGWWDVARPISYAADQYRYFHDGQEVDGEDFKGFAEEGSVYTDGSCIRGSSPWPIAGAAAVQLQQGVWVAVLAPNPVYCPQTAAFAEHLAVLMASSKALGPIHIITDCNAVLKTFLAGPLLADRPTIAAAGIWRQVVWSKIASITKCKAHMPANLIPMLEGEAKLIFEGNFYADLKAKQAAGFADFPAAQVESWEKDFATTKKLLRGVAVILQKWPKPGPMGRARQAPSRRSPGTTWQAHHYLWLPDFRAFVCSRCQHAKSRCKHKRDLSACVPVNGLLLKMIAASPGLGHQLWISPCKDGSSTILFCMKCGAYAERRGNSLRRPCNPQSAQRLLIHHFKEGRHPVSKQPLGKPYRAG